MEKGTLRGRLKSKRLKLSDAQIDMLSHKIVNLTWEIIDWPNIHFVHCYLPIHTNNEVNILPLLRAARQLNPSLKIATSLYAQDQPWWLDESLQPANEVKANVQYGLILVPMLGFDKQGFRLGYGGGFYDRFLATQELAQIIGVCYEIGKIPKIKHEAHDIPLPVIVTENAIYKF